MKIAQLITKKYSNYFDGKKILDVASKEGTFAIAASNYAENVMIADKDLKIVERNLLPKNVEFKNIEYDNFEMLDESVDVSVCYNSLDEIDEYMEESIEEMTRVTKKGGNIIFISTWSKDIKMMQKIETKMHINQNLGGVRTIRNDRYSVLIAKRA